MKYLLKIQKEADKVFANVITENFQDKETITEFTYKDAVIIGLLENLINHSKSLSLLIENRHHISTDIILRTIFENYIYLKFVLEKDSIWRAKSYAYSNRISEFQMLDKLTEQSLKGREIRKLLQVTLDEVISKYKEEERPGRREEIETSYLNEFGMKRVEQKWYNLDGETKTFKALCIKMKMEPEYEILYSMLSTETHGKDAMEKLDIQKFFVSVKHSYAKDSSLHISMASLYLLESVRIIYRHYQMKEKLRHFNAMLKIHKKY